MMFETYIGKNSMFFFVDKVKYFVNTSLEAEFLMGIVLDMKTHLQVKDCEGGIVRNTATWQYLRKQIWIAGIFIMMMCKIL